LRNNNSCWNRMPICPIVRPSWGNLVPSCGLRFCFEWSMSSDIFRHTKTLWRKREGCRPSCRLRSSVRWHRDGTTIRAESRIWILKSPTLSRKCIWHSEFCWRPCLRDERHAGKNRNLCHTLQPHQTETSGHSQQPDGLRGPKPRRHSRCMEKWQSTSGCLPWEGKEYWDPGRQTN